MLRTPNQVPHTSPLVIEAAGQRYKQTTSFCTWTVMSARGLTLCQRSHDGFDSHRHARSGPHRSYMISSMARSLRTPNQAPQASPLVFEAAGQWRRRTVPLFCTRKALSLQALTLCQRSYDGSDSHRHARMGSNGGGMAWRVPRSL